jgi:Arc/MetJ family transcription regulator
LGRPPVSAPQLLNPAIHHSFNHSFNDLPVMRTTIEIDDHLLDAVRDLARMRRCTNGAVVSDLLRQALLGERVASTGAPMSSTAVVNRIRQQLIGL